MAKPLLQKLLILIAVLILVPLYYVWHKPFDPALALLLGGAAADLVTVAVIAIISGGIGKRLLWRFAADWLSLPERVALESATGLGIISIGALFFALIGLFNSAMWAALTVTGMLVLRPAWHWLRDFRHVCRDALRPQSTWTRLIVFYALFVLGSALLIALAPPNYWDAMVYHLEAPRRYLEVGRMLAQPDVHYMGFPQGMEMLYGLSMALFGRDTAAAPLHFYTGLLALMAVAGIVRRYTDRPTAYMAILLPLSSYSLWLLFRIPYVDLVVMLYGTLMVIAFLRWRSTEDPAWLLICGVIAGFAIGIKYTAGVMAVALLLAIILHRPRQLITNGLRFGLPLLLVFSPWMLRGVLLYQNPLYPYLIGGLNWDTIRTVNFNQAGLGMLSEPSLTWHIALLPFTATIFGDQQIAPYQWTAGLWLLTAPFLLIFVWQRLNDDQRDLAKQMILLIIPFWLLWMVTAATSGIGAQPRLLLVGTGPVIILGSLAFAAIARLPKRPLDLTFVLTSIIALTLFLGSLEMMQTVVRTQIIPYMTGNILKETYLLGRPGLYYAVVRDLDDLPPESTVQFMWEPQSYYCPDDITCIPDPLYDNWSYPIMTGTDPDDLMQQWRDSGVDYLLVYGLKAGQGEGYNRWVNYNPHTRETDLLFPDTLETWMAPVWTDDIAGVYTLYTWRESPDE